MAWTYPRRGVALMALGLLALAGCSGNPSLGPVEGTLRMNGKPLANVQVEFLPEANGPRSTGVTDQDGHYTLTSNDQKPGAVLGSHRVLLYDLQVYDDKPAGHAKKDQDVTPVRSSRIPVQYTNTASTPLKKEVHKEPNTIDLEVTGS
jgi:hypothetical protein